MPAPRKMWKIFPIAIVCVLVWCIIFQESFVLDRTEVHQEIVYKFNALEQNQLGSDFEHARSSFAIDTQIVNELVFKRAIKKSVKNRTTGKRPDWFDRSNPAPSDQVLDDHPLFPGYVIENPDLCQDKPVDILIYVHSAVEHFGKRRVIRETWGGTKLFHDITIRTVFILGRPVTPSDQTDVLTEYAAHGDIVQGDFVDTFRNLTLKAVTILAWVNWHCPQAKYLMKSDDDYFVDTFGVVEDLLPKIAKTQRALLCRYSANFEIIRNTNIKWHIEADIMSSRTHWPPFCSGFFVVYTGDVIPLLYDNSFNVTEYVSVDDVYLFGLLTEGNPNITFLDIHDKISVNTRPKPEDEVSNSGRFEFSVFEIELPETSRSLWDFRLKRLSDWGRSHSLYVKLFENSKKGTVIIS